MKRIFSIQKVLFLSFLFSTTVVSAQIPDNYYDSAFGRKKDALKTAIKTIIRPHTARSYNQLWTDFQSTDNKGNNIVWDMYSDKPTGTPAYVYHYTGDQCGNYAGEGDCYNREHSMPKSWFNDETPMYTDLFHLYPTDGYVNGRRGNDPFGEVGTVNWTSTNGSKSGKGSTASGYTGNVFEPIDTYKGDFARTYFYMVTCYEDNVSSWSSPMLSGNRYPAFQTWAVNLLLKWSREDQVSQKETDRNNAVYAIQGNRNPFIDYPQLAEYIWGDSITYDFNPGKATHIEFEESFDKPLLYAINHTLYIENLWGESIVHIYNSMGILLDVKKLTTDTYTTALPDEKFFIVKVIDKNGVSNTYKIINR